jgi:hypothetical protein
MTFTMRRILLVAMAVAMIGMIAPASGCAKHPQPSRPAAAAPDTRSGEAASTSGAAPSTSDVAAATLSVDDQVREAVFRHQFKHNASGIKDRAAVYFLAIDEHGKRRDPSPALMARFAQHRPRVEAVSRASGSFDEGVRHRETGEQGILFHVKAIKPVRDGVVEVEGGYYEGNLSSSGNFYRVERKAGVWVVTDDKMEWIA